MKTIMTQQKSFYKILIVFINVFFTSYCYFNPVINSIVSPGDTKADNTGLVLLAGLPSGSSNATLQVTGILKNSSGTALGNTNIIVGPIFSSSIKDTPISTTTTTTSSGNFLIKLFPGTVPISVTDSNGAFLGGFTLIVTSTTATQGTTPSSPFIVESLTVYGINDNVSLETAPVGFIIVSTNPADGATNVPVSATFSVDYVFSKSVDTSTLTQSNISFKIGASESAKTVNFTGSGTNITLIFGGGNIYSNMTYKITPTVAVKDMEGNAITPKTITITTGMAL